MRGRRRLILILAVSAVLIGSGRENVWGQSREEPLWEKGDGQSIWEMEEGGLDWSELEQFLKEEVAGTGKELSFTELVQALIEGRGKDAGRMILDGLRESFLGEMENGGAMAVQLLTLGLLGAVFSGFSEIFSGDQMSEAGFFVIYLMTFTVMAAFFLESADTAVQVLEKQILFMKALMPSYFAAVVWAGAAAASVAWYELVLFLISMVQGMYVRLVLPLIQIYVMLVLVGNVMKEDMLSKMTELLKTGIFWGLRWLLGLVAGFHLVQGMVLPYADAIKTSGMEKLLQAIPGIGAGAGAVTKLVLGSGVLIKNTMGAAAVVILVLLSLAPLVKLWFFFMLYRIVAAILEPVADKRLVGCISGVAEGQKMLLHAAVSGLVLFVITIALICVGTNAAYLA